MKKITILLGLLLIATISLCDTHIPAGDVSGIWTIDGSPYIIDGEIDIPIDSTLTIEPSVQVLFSGHYKFNIYGRILAEGTANDTIVFTAQDTTVGWHSLRFYNTNFNGQDSSKIVYCKLEYGKAVGDDTNDLTGGAIYLSNSSNILISNCNISNNIATWGGGIGCYSNANPLIIDNIIKNNHAFHSGYNNGCGGGIFCSIYSSPLIKGNIIKNNQVEDYGGGISVFYGSNPMIVNNTIKSNSACAGAGIVLGTNGKATISQNTITDNNCTNEGGGICLSGAQASTIYDNIIRNNNAFYGGGMLFFKTTIGHTITNNIIIYNNADFGGGLCWFTETPIGQTLINNTICNNNAMINGGGIYCWYEYGPILVNCILWDNIPQEIHGDSVTATYSDIQGGWSGQGNIDADPLFADPQNGDFHLTWANFPIPDSTMSPCIDAGDPNSSLDPDSTRADMGAFYFDQNQQGVEEMQILPTRFLLYQNYPNPFNPDNIRTTTISFNLATNYTNLHEQARIEIYNIKGQLVKQLTIDNSQLSPIQSGREQSSIIWDGKDEKGEVVSSGIYFYILKVGNKVMDIKKSLILR